MVDCAEVYRMTSSDKTEPKERMYGTAQLHRDTIKTVLEISPKTKGLLLQVAV